MAAATLIRQLASVQRSDVNDSGKFTPLVDRQRHNDDDDAAAACYPRTITYLSIPNHEVSQITQRS